MDEPTMRDRIAKAIDAVETVEYSLLLTRLVDGESTYTLTIAGVDPMEFPSLDDAHKHLRALTTAAKVEAVLRAMREPTDAMIMAGIIERHDAETPEAWKLATANIFTAMIEAA